MKIALKQKTTVKRQGVKNTSELLEGKIFLFRGLRVMVDRDLAELYGVPTKHLNRQVRRNQKRFPLAFMFRLNRKETRELVTNWHRFQSLKYSSSKPYVFTEHGAVMLASVLNTPQAIRLSIVVVKAFIKFKNEYSIYRELLQHLQRVDGKVKMHDQKIRMVIQALSALINSSKKDIPQKQMGFHVRD